MKTSVQLIIWLCVCLGLIDLGSCSQSNDCNYVPSRSSFLWRIDTQPPVYLLGTIHVPYTAVWDSLSPAVKLALDSVQRVHFELDLTSQSTLNGLAQCQLIENPGTQLEDLLPSGMTERVSRYLSELSQQLTQPHQASVFAALTENWRRRRPIWLALSLASLTPADLATFGTEVLDVFLTRRARRRGQWVAALESVDDQCRPLNSVPTDQAALALDLTLTHLEDQLARFLHSRVLGGAPPAVDTTAETDLIRGYRCGSLDELAANNASFLPPDAVAKLREPQLSLYNSLVRELEQSLMRNRNRRMATRVINSMATRRGESQLFAVGVGHLLGAEHSVVSHLRSAGYRVDPVHWNATGTAAAPTANNNNNNNNNRANNEQVQMQELPNYRNWRNAEERRQQRQDAEWAVWEEAKKFARLKWKPQKSDLDYNQPLDPENQQSQESLNLIKSAVRTLASDAAFCTVLLIGRVLSTSSTSLW